MAAVPDNLYYTKDHEWVKVEGDLLLVGITDYAAGSLGDIVYLDFSPEGTELAAGDTFGAIESVKAAEDLYAPVAGTIGEVNSALQESPELVNQKPYDSWMIKLRNHSAGDLKSLMDAAAYRELLSSL